MAQALSPTGRHRLGAGLLLLQPVVIAVQLVVATRWHGFDPLVETVSDLGTAASPWHALMNAGFVVIGGALAVGAWLAAPSLGRAAPLLVVAGVCSLAVGLVPVDRSPGLHSLVALPVFVTQPVALLLLARRTASGPLSRALLAAGVAAAVGAVAFGLTLALDEPGGLAERIALWSCHLGVALVGVGVMRGLLLEDR